MFIVLTTSVTTAATLLYFTYVSAFRILLRSINSHNPYTVCKTENAGTK